MIEVTTLVIGILNDDIQHWAYQLRDITQEEFPIGSTNRIILLTIL
jgi:hypothetical protein